MFGVDLKLGINLRKIIVIDFMIVNLFRIGPVVFLFKKKVFHINFCVFGVIVHWKLIKIIFKIF